MASSIGTFLDSMTVSNQLEKKKIKTYSKTELSNITKKKLLSYQCGHVVKLVKILVTKYVALDSSDTGVGKTYIAAAVCKELGRKPVIICPKTLIPTWISVLEYFEVESYDIVNYETIKNCKTYKNDKYKSRINSPYVKKIDVDPEDAIKYVYDWDLDNDVIVIFDESHRCKDPSTDNGKLLVSCKKLIDKKIPILLLSATICEKITDMRIPFFLFSLIDTVRQFNSYIKTLAVKYPKYNIRKRNYETIDDYKLAKENAEAMYIYEEIREHSSRIRIKDLGDKFPLNQVCCQQFFAEKAEQIKIAYEEIALLMEELKNNPGTHHLARITKLKQEIELSKVPIFIEQAKLYMEEGKSVVIFVNYRLTLQLIADELDIQCQIHGDQTMDERQEAIALFQSNEENIIICQIRAGGIGISLHDLHGDHPRVSLINFPDSATDLIQALGRIYRAGARSVAIQRIIFVANVDYEKSIMKNINRKLTNLSATNDGDLTGYKYNVKNIKRRIVDKK